MSLLDAQPHRPYICLPAFATLCALLLAVFPPMVKSLKQFNKQYRHPPHGAGECTNPFDPYFKPIGSSEDMQPLADNGAANFQLGRDAEKLPAVLLRRYVRPEAQREPRGQQPGLYSSRLRTR